MGRPAVSPNSGGPVDRDKTLLGLRPNTACDAVSVEENSMTTRNSEKDALVFAGAAGVPLSDEAARNAGSATAGPLAAADVHSRKLAFEAEPGQFAAYQQAARR